MTQERLSTGKKVNSAIDNPSSYYTAQSLTNRASDLNALLDSMGQGIQTIQAANEGIEAITEFVQQAKAIANTARDNATIKGTTSSGTYAAADDTQNITVKIDGVADQDIEVTLADTDTLEQAATKIATALNDGTDGVKDAEDTVIGGFTATVENGQIKISNSKGIVANVSGTISGITFNGEIGNSTRTTSMKQYNEILDQIDQLAKDSGYKGVNLLQGNDLKVVFNEDRSSYLTINGTFADTSDKGLKISRAEDWTNPDNEAIDASISELENAITSLRNMASEFGNNYSIVENRENFTESLINVLEEGSDKLTLADMNEESANMLALQTRQQLAINSLSLASQAAQSVLSLF
ncbi:putative flagellin protein C-terminus [Azospirillum sp. CAG:239]|nr:putative flagellin protein C-terminus [Azospirillum sp. CAG:239]